MINDIIESLNKADYTKYEIIDILNSLEYKVHSEPAQFLHEIVDRKEEFAKDNNVCPSCGCDTFEKEEFIVHDELDFGRLEPYMISFCNSCGWEED